METASHIPEFGTKRENEERRDGGCAVVFDPKTQRYAVGARERDGLFLLFSGGVEEGEDVQAGILREVTEESGLHAFRHIEKIAEAYTHYHNRAKNVNRIGHATCLLVVLDSADTVPVKLEPHEDFVLRWVTPSEIFVNWESRNGDHGLDHWVYFLGQSVARAAALGFDTASDAPGCEAEAAKALAMAS